MKKLMFVAVAALSTVAFAAHEDLSAEVEGYYDVQLTTKRLAHSEKTVTKSFTTSSSKGSAVSQFWAHMATVTNYAGFAVVKGYPTCNGVVVEYPEGVTDVKSIKIKYTYFDFKVTTTTKKNDTTNYVTKVISETNKGVYDSESGKVYLWSSASADKVTMKQSDPSALPGLTKDTKGYVAYEVPLAIHKQFIKTDDNKAAGGFVGGKNVAKDGTVLDFEGLTAFGTGTFDSKNFYVKTVSGNVAGKYPNDLKFGCYGTWKVSKDTKTYTDLNAVLLKKSCVELVNERD